MNLLCNKTLLRLLPFSVCLICCEICRGEQTAESVLTSRGLTNLPGTAVWADNNELRLRKLDKQADGLHRRLRAIEADLAQRIERNRVIWRSDGRNGRAVEPAQLANVSSVRARIIDLIDVRCELTATIQKMRRAATRSATVYEALQDDPAVGFALQSLGQAHRLGPAKRYESYLNRLRDYETAVLTEWTPAFWQADELRLCGMINEQTRATFSWHPGQKMALIPSSMAEIAGVRIPDDAENGEIRYAGRTVRVKQFRLPYLQFGNCLLRDVEACLLPPEAEDLGASLGRATFRGYRVSIQPERLRIVLNPTD